jgi:hypothetical protein
MLHGHFYDVRTFLAGANIFRIANILMMRGHFGLSKHFWFAQTFLVCANIFGLLKQFWLAQTFS